MKDWEHQLTDRDEWLYSEFKKRLIMEVVTPSAGEVCPCCNRKMPMTAVQRKRKQRAKQKQVN